MPPFKQRLTDLRQHMAKHRLAAFIVPRNDEFQGEEVPAHAERLKWLTGFSGSWGTAVVMAKSATLFVDGRYTVQSRQQVDGRLFDFEDLMAKPPAMWLSGKLKARDRVGFDPWLHTPADVRKLEAACAEMKAVLVPVARNLIDQCWADQPAPPATAIIDHPLKFAGQTTADKLKAIAAVLKEKNASAVVLADPASVAWTLNIRGSDVPHMPVPLAFAIVHATGKAELFATPIRITAQTRKAIGSRITLRAPSEMNASLTALGKKKSVVMLDGAKVPQAVALTLKHAGAKIIEGNDPCTLPKAQKNRTEQQGARDAQIRDGAALANFLCWIDHNAPSGKITEFQAQSKLHEFRKATGLLVDLSFGSISASGPNAALPHYHVVGTRGRALKNNEIYLIDSGGQYRDGTTDVTRTVIFGKPTAEMKDRFTRVLKGMIAISVARFPQGCTGAHIDALARNALWQGGYDFDHGTGHGVGSFLSVHEGPASISKRSHVVIAPGMILSNEPGYYKINHYGIRTENLLLVTEPEKIKGADRAMLTFETLTFAPIDRRLIDTHMLTRAELQWLDHYHAQVLKKLLPLVDKATKPWLKKVCARLT
jgi:Xaa-Pro aminopeptidase